MPAVHQFLATYAPRDAIGTHARHARAILRDMGVESEIFAEGVRGASRREARHFRAFADRPRPPGTQLLYQLSTGSSVGEFLLTRPERRVVNYHNITDASFFAPWEAHVAVELREGRRQLRQLAPHVDLAIAVSRFNEDDLRAAGYRRTVVAPVLVDLDATAAEPDPAALGRLLGAKRDGGRDWLFVGRVAPHKCQHDVVRSFAAYRRLYDPRARLHLVGGASSHAYLRALERFVDAAGLGEAVELAGSVADAVLAAHYAAADVFVCLSEHEGFCVPIIEAMRTGVPVVAFAAAAVPETIAGAGVLLQGKDPATVAAAVARVAGAGAGDSAGDGSGGDLRRRLVAAGRARAADFALERTAPRFRALMEQLVAEAACA